MSLALNKPKLDNLAGDIWKSAERLRGKFKAYEYQNVILPIIVMLPDQLFYNTGIFTYIWLLRNDKPASHRGRVMIIDARQQFEKEPKAFSFKRNRLTDAHRSWIEERYSKGWAKGHADEQVKLFRREDFAYHKVKAVFWQTDENDQPAVVTEPYTKAFTAANMKRELDFHASEITFRATIKTGRQERPVELVLCPGDLCPHLSCARRQSRRHPALLGHRAGHCRETAGVGLGRIRGGVGGCGFAAGIPRCPRVFSQQRMADAPVFLGVFRPQVS